MDDPVWDVTVFTKNRDRLLDGDIARNFLERPCWSSPQVKPLLSSEHFSVDGTLIEAWAGLKSFRPKDGGGEPPAPGPTTERLPWPEAQQRDARLDDGCGCQVVKQMHRIRARLCHMGHVVMENRNGLVVAATVTPATGTAEREAGLRASVSSMNPPAPQNRCGDKLMTIAIARPDV